MNFHEIVREVLDRFRARFPGALIDLEHRGDGEGRWDRDALESELEKIFAGVLPLADGSSLWLRSDARDGDEVSLRLDVDGDGIGPRVVLRLPRGLA